jgi:hypothetical protein
VILPPRTKVLACRVLEPELRSLGLEEERVEYLDQGLHRYPDELRERLSQALAGMGKNKHIKRVVLGYGYCGGGLEGLSSGRLEMILPRIHDCIPLLLGKNKPEQEGPGSEAFYLSAGWIDYGQTPYTEYSKTAGKYDDETALWVGREMLKGYGRVVLIRTIASLKVRHYKYARDMAGLFGMSLEQARGDAGWLHRLLTAQPGPDILRLAPGQTIRLDLYQERSSTPRLQVDRP